MTYQWIITKDHIEDGRREGVYGPHSKDEKGVPDPMTGEPFKLYDDDEELYAEGRIAGDYDGFEPLDDYGMPNWGCTGIKYRTPDGTWDYL